MTHKINSSVLFPTNRPTNSTMSSTTQESATPAAAAPKKIELAKATKATYVRLVSSDGFTFWVPRAAASFSTTMKAVFDLPTGDDDSASVPEYPSRQIPSDIFNLVARYMVWKFLDEEYNTHYQELDFPERYFHIPADKVIELLKASHFLDV